MVYYDRKNKELINEKEYKQAALKFLYNTILGRILLKLFIARPWISKLGGLYQKSPLSKGKIKSFVDEYNIDLTEEEIKEFKSFNDFFIRERKKEIKETDKKELVSPADAKLSIYNITDDLKLKIKNSTYNIVDIVKDEDIAEKFKNGTCLVFRLSVNDNHHYTYIDDGEIVFNKKIKGQLHTIRSISDKYNVYAHNAREVSLLKTENLGDVVQIEVGALLIGKIKNNNRTKFRRNEEKGYFEFGGSTIVILLNKEIEFDKDIVKKNILCTETQVMAGEKIGIVKD